MAYLGLAMIVEFSCLPLLRVSEGTVPRRPDGITVHVLWALRHSAVESSKSSQQSAIEQAVDGRGPPGALANSLGLARIETMNER